MDGNTRQTSIRGHCPQCNESYVVNNNGNLRRHVCGIVQANENDWRQQLNHQRVNHEQNSTINWSKKKRVWAMKVTEIMQRIKTAEMEKNEQEFQTYLNRAMMEIYDLTPPGSRPFKTNQENSYENSGCPIDYTISEQKGMSKDQTVNAQKMNLINKTLFQHKRIAKVQQILFSNGVAELARPEVRDNLRSKFREEAIPKPRENIEWLETIQNYEMIEEDNMVHDYNNHLYTHIMGKKRGNGKSISGWSYDHIQDLISIDPENFTLISEIIPHLHGMSEMAEEKYKMNKGTALNKKKDAIDVRPIGCKNPFMSIAGHMARFQEHKKIQHLCGSTQMGGGIKGGVETIPHLLRTYLQNNPNHVVLKKDAKNAWGSLAKWAALGAIQADFQDTAFEKAAVWEIGGITASTVFHDNRYGIAEKIYHYDGMLQGSNIAGDIYNLVQARVLNYGMSNVANREIRPGEEGYVNHIEDYDDVYIYGDPRSCIQLDEIYDREMEKIGVYQNLNKRYVYGYGDYSPDILEPIQQRHYQHATEGVVVVGAPIGKPEYEIQKCMERTNEIKGKIDELLTFLSNTATYTKAQKQWIFQLLRLCMPSSMNYLLRTVHPDHTLEAAKELDTHLVDFVLRLTKCKGKYDGIDNDRERSRIVDQILLQISRGGLGIQCSEDVRRMAYIGSWALTGQRIEGMLGLDQLTNVRGDVARHLEQMRTMDIIQEDEWSVESLFEQQRDQVQRELSRKFATIKGNRVFAMVAQDMPATGLSFQDQDPMTNARIHQAKANMDSAASAWLTAFPTHPRSIMNNSAFEIAVRNRLLLDCFGEGNEKETRACRGCRKRETYNGSHVRCGCQKMIQQGTRQPMRNKQHTEVQEALKAIIQATPEYGYAVSGRPSNLMDKFGMIEGSRIEEEQQQMYGDVLLIDKTGTRPDIVIDTTVATTHGVNHHSTQPGDAADKAEKIKREKWRRKGFDIKDNPRARMVVFAIDQSGALGSSARKFIRELSGDESWKWRSRCEWLSVELQSILARTIVKAESLIYVVGARPMNRRSRTEVAIDDEESVAESISSNSEASEDSGSLLATRHTRSNRMRESAGGLIQTLLVVRR